MQISPAVINEKSTREYTIVRLGKHNISDLAKLHKDVYDSDMEPGYFKHKYDTGFTGVSHVGYIAYNSHDLPIAFYGVIPCFIQHHEKIILAAQSADTMTHPQYRYKGMFVELSNMTFELCKQSGILFIFGFPNQNSYHGAVNKLGWQMKGQMVLFKIPVKAIPFNNFFFKTPLLKSIYKNYFNLVTGKHTQTGIPNAAVADGFAGVYRDAEYLAYKSFCGAKVIRAGDAKIWVSNKPGLQIGDIEGLNENNFNDVILKLKAIAQKLGIPEIHFHCSPGTLLHRIFSAFYTGYPSYPMLFQDFGATISPDDARFCLADIDIF